MLATRNLGDWHIVVGKVYHGAQCRRRMDSQQKSTALAEVLPANAGLLASAEQTVLIFLGRIDQTCCNIMNVLQLVVFAQKVKQLQ